MELVTIVIILALIEYGVFGSCVAKARKTYNVPAPAISGNEIFERYFRVHQNTLEGLVIFIPAIFAFATYVQAEVAAGLGLFSIVGRAIYFRGYVKDPESRGLGSMLAGIPVMILLLGSLIGAVMAML